MVFGIKQRVLRYVIEGWNNGAGSYLSCSCYAVEKMYKLLAYNKLDAKVDKNNLIEYAGNYWLH